MAKKPSSKEVTKTGDKGALAVPSYIKQGMNRGSELQTMDDQVVPRLGLIQDLSPQHKKNKPEYIPGAEPGMLFNTATQKLYGTELVLVNVFFDKEYLLWRDQEAGGGFGGAFRTMADAEAARLSKDDPDEWEVNDTAQHYCLIQDEETGEIEPIVVSLSKSKMKASRPWNSLIQALGGDRFSRTYEIVTVEDQNDNNQDYWNIKARHVGFPSEELYHKAEEFYEFIKSGKVKVGYGEGDDVPAPAAKPSKSRRGSAGGDDTDGRFD